MNNTHHYNQSFLSLEEKEQEQEVSDIHLLTLSRKKIAFLSLNIGKTRSKSSLVYFCPQTTKKMAIRAQYLPLNPKASAKKSQTLCWLQQKAVLYIFPESTVLRAVPTILMPQSTQRTMWQRNRL